MNCFKNFIYNFSFFCSSSGIFFRIEITKTANENLKTTTIQERLLSVLLLSVEHKLCEKSLHDSTKISEFLKIKARKIVCDEYIIIYSFCMQLL